MDFSEEALVFQLAGDDLLGVLARPDAPSATGVLLVVGGPQYRAGSHRQFTLLSRRLAAGGFPVLRFDCRGMGDSAGAMRSFEQLNDDVAAAIDALLAACPTVRRVVLWGLCDAASAALLYLEARCDPRVSGLALLNPWVRSETTLAQTHVRHYYGHRLLQRSFWIKLLSGKMALWAACREFLHKLSKMREPRSKTPRPDTYQNRMAEGLRRFDGAVLLVCSGQDYTAREFLDLLAANPEWARLINRSGVTRIDLADADHTFSSAVWRAMVEDETLKWLRRIETMN